MNTPRSARSELQEWLRSEDLLLYLKVLPDGWRELLADAGFVPRVVDLIGAESKADLMEAFKVSLGLDAWFGANWDALNDALYGPEEPGTPPVILVLRQPEAGLKLPKQDFQTLLDIVTEVAESERSTLQGAIILSPEP
jgi:RNAse (barnase) inhibitor barstar